MDKQGRIDRNGKTVTFYSYKGGVGRSMVLANSACLLAREGKKVLLIDWDLEAPGLHYFFNENNDALGFVDLMNDSYELIQKEENNNEEKYCQFFEENMHKYISKDLAPKTNTSLNSQNSIPTDVKIDLITSGKFDKEYSKKLGAINWIEFYKKAPAYFRTLAYYLERDYDYIFVDSRTGLADTSGISTMLMPSKLVLVFVLNNQNIRGVLDVAAQTIDYRLNSNDYRKLDIYPLPSRIENTVITDFEDWKSKYTIPFQNLFKEKYMLDECNLSDYFERCSISYYPKHAYGENLPVLNESITDSKNIAYDYNNFLTVLKEGKQSWETISRERELENERKSSEIYNNAYKLYIDKKYEEAIIEANKALELNEKNKDAYNVIGMVKHQQENYLEAIEYYKKALEIDADYFFAFFNIGIAKSKLLQLKDAIPFYTKAIELNPKEVGPYFNRGLSFLLLHIFDKAKPDILKAIELDSSNSNAYNLLATILRVEKDYNSALINNDKAIELLPTEPVYFVTKAEVYADMKNLSGFYENFEKALSLGLKKEQLKDNGAYYTKYLSDSKFTDLLSKYNFNINDLQTINEESIPQ